MSAPQPPSSSFFFGRTPEKQKNTRRRRNTKALLLFLISAAYGLFAFFIINISLHGHQSVSMLVLYVYGLIGGFGFLLLKQIYTDADRSRKILTEVLEKSAEARAITNPEGETIYTNLRFNRLVGDEENPSLVSFTKIFHDPFQTEKDLALLRQRAVPTGSAMAEFHTATKDRPLWFQVTSQYIVGWPGFTHWRFDDISHRYEMEAAIHEEQEKFRRLFEEAPVGICMLNTNGIIGDANQTLAAMLHLPSQNINGKPLTNYLGKESHQRVAEWLQSLSRGAKAAPFIEVPLKGPQEIVTQLYARKFSSSDALVLHFIDLTEQKNLEKQFTQSQKMQAVGQLAGGIAHDFNNLLTAMIGFCDLLLLRHKPGDPSFADIMQIKQNANRAANLVRQLLAFSRQQTLQPRVLDLADVLTELSHLLRRLIGSNIDLRIEHGSELGLVKADQGQMEQALINLAVNARDAMVQGGKLMIRTDNFTSKTTHKLNSEESLPPGDWVKIVVEDTGTGIAPDTLPHIFEPFFSTKAVGAGTGLGLATVHGIIHQTGGYITVDTTMGKGTTFTLYLPRHKESAGERKTGQPEEKAVMTDLTGSSSILLVEDEDAVRIFSARALSNKGYQVVDAPSAAVALRLLEDRKIEPEVLITDVMMPEMDGPALAKIVREKYPHIKIIFISGYAEDKFKEHLGANVYFLPKPFTLKQLATKVKEVIEDKGV